MKDVYIVINNTDSQWGASVARMTVPDSTIDLNVHSELSCAKSDLEETGIPEEWTTPDINEAILNLAAQQLGATWCYVGCVEFEYRYEGEYVEEIDDETSQKMREAVKNRLEKERRMQSE